VRLRTAGFLPAIALSLFLPVSLFASGPNKVIAHSLQWKIARTAHFDIHFTRDSAPWVPFAAKTAEAAYDRLTRALGVVPSERTSLFLFPNHNIFEENNIADVDEGTGGVTEAFKNRIIVFSDGTRSWMEDVITHEFSHVLQFEILYGGFWKSARLLKSPLYPLWVMEGEAEWGTGEMDRVQEDLVLRDAALDGTLPSLFELHGFNHLKPHQVTLAYKSGASAIRFLAEKYGPDFPGKLLKAMRDRFDVPTLVSELTHKDFKAFNTQWREHLRAHYAAQAARLALKDPETFGARLTAPPPLPAFDEAPALSPDGGFLAFITDRRGPPEVAVMDLKSGAVRFLAGRPSDRIEYVHAEQHALSFSADGRWLAFVGEKEQRDYLYLYDLKRDRFRRIRTPFEQIRSPVFHPSEDRLVVVGLKDGVNDLYEISSRGRLLRRLTDTAEDKSGPAWSPDGRSIAYSVEVQTGTRFERDLALLDVNTLAVRRVTSLPGRETSPVWTPDGKSLIFVGDALENVRNLYRLDLAHGRTLLLTRVTGGISSPTLNRDGSRMVFSSLRHGSMNLYSAGPELWNPSADKADVARAEGPENAEALAAGAKAGGWENNPALSSYFPALPSSPYRFRASTDLFFPVFYYSSQDGLFLATLWQASEHLGDHQIQGTLQYGSGTNFLDYNLEYRYVRFRPQFVASLSGDKFYEDVDRIEQRLDQQKAVGVIYPLDRFLSVETLLTDTRWDDRIGGDTPSRTLSEENAASLSLARDTTTGRWLETTDGSRAELTQTEARPVYGGTWEYDATQAVFERFLPTGGESAVAFRGVAGTSDGPTPKLFRIGGGDRLRGYSRNGDENYASRYVIGNLEWRMPLKYLGGGGAPLLPEVAFKAIFGALFIDGGYDGTPIDLMALGARRERASAGAGLRIPTFIFQTYPLTLSVDLAKRLDANRWAWYLYLGPRF